MIYNFVIYPFFQYWDDDLAKLADLHVVNCHFEHDKCHATSKYWFPGQNIAIQMTSGKPAPIPNALDKGITDWWNEYKLVDQSRVQELLESYEFKLGFRPRSCEIYVQTLIIYTFHKTAGGTIFLYFALVSKQCSKLIMKMFYYVSASTQATSLL